MARLGYCGRQGRERLGRAWRGEAWQALCLLLRACSLTSSGVAGEAGKARKGSAGLGMARQARRG